MTEPESTNESPGLLRLAYGISGLLLCVVVGAVVFAQCSTPEPEPPPMPSARVADPVVAQESSEDLIGLITEARNEREVVSLLRPLWLGNQTKSLQGVAALVAWSAKRLTWTGMAELPDSSFARAQKDIAYELGKRVCLIGVVSEIETDRSVQFPLAQGGIVADDGVFRFYAVRSTRDILEERRARFCGIIVGRVTFTNTLGSSVRAISLVGMFDMPENRKALASR